MATLVAMEKKSRKMARMGPEARNQPGDRTAGSLAGHASGLRRLSWIGLLRWIGATLPCPLPAGFPGLPLP